MRLQERSKRYRRHLPVSLGGRIPAMTVNVSLSGFQMEMPQVFLPGSLIHGYFIDGKEEIPFRGEVAWAKPGNPQLSHYSVMGIRFVSVSGRLEKMLAKNQAT